MRRLVAAIAAASCAIARGNVIGVDLGVDYMKVALVAPRKPLEIVTNTASKRKTEVAICFDRSERSFGSDAAVLLARKPKSTFTKLTTLLGRGPDSPAVQELKDSGVPCDMFFNDTRGGFAVKLEDSGTESSFLVEELVSMMLGHALLITKMYGATVKDAVLTVPEFYTAHERQALLDSAELAGLNVLTLVDENTAAALQLAIDRTFDENHTVLFYNMGANSVQVTVATFGPKMDKGKNVGQVTIKGKAWDATLGGGQFDLRVANMLAEGFNAKWGKGDVKEFVRPMCKIRNRAAKVKEVLSANTAIPVTLESLHDDVDFTTSLTRADFEKKCEDLFARLTGPIDAALAAAGMTLKDIDSVEVLGGGVRVPKVQDTLKAYLATAGKDGVAPDLGVHLNGDEAMALGAAFRGANISRAFAVRQVGVTDITPFAVDISLRDAPLAADAATGGMLGGIFGGGNKDKEKAEAAAAAAGGEDVFYKQQSFYYAGMTLPYKKSFTLAHARDLEVNLTYAAEENPQLPAGTQPLIATYNVTGIVKFAKEMEEAGHGMPKVALRFLVENNQIPTLSSAEAYVEFEKEVTYEELVDDPEATAAAAAAAAAEAEKAGDKAAAGDDAGSSDSGSDASDGDEDAAAKEGEDSSSSGSSEADKGKSKSKDKKAKGKDKAPKPKKKMVTKTRTITDKKKQKLTVERILEGAPGAVVRPLTAEEKAQAKARLAALDAADDARRLKAEAKNGLEAYILSVRSKLDDRADAVAEVSTEEQREAVTDLARQLEDWLYDEGWDEDAPTYRRKRAELATPAEAIFLRMAEVTDRPAAVEAARASLAKVTEMVGKWEAAKPQITQAEREEVLGKVKAAEEWLTTKEAEQAAKASHEVPAFTSADIEPHLKIVRSLVAKLAKKPAPPPPKKAANATDSETAANATASDSAEAGAGEDAGEGDAASGGADGEAGAEETDSADAGANEGGSGGAGSGGAGEGDEDHDEL